jgi:ATP-dependent DNA helicase RecG
MIIEGAERFGLAQLYQFRGRVGRGGHQSFCLLFTDSSSKETLKRLDALLEAKNGFELAEKDLSLRGPGEFLGTEQTGFPDIIMSALKNRDLIKKSRDAAEEILKIDPRLQSYPKLKEKLSTFSKETHLE